MAKYEVYHKLYLVSEGEVYDVDHVDPAAVAIWGSEGGSWEGWPEGASRAPHDWVLAWASSPDEALALARRYDAGEIGPDNVTIPGCPVGIVALAG